MLFRLYVPMRFPRVLLPLLAGLAVLASVGVPAARAQQADPQRQRQLKEQILEAGEQEAAALQELQAIRDRKAPIDARVAELDAQMREVLVRLAPLEDQVAQPGVQLAEAQGRLEQRQAEYELAKAEVERSAAQIYRSARRGAAYDYVTASRPEDLVQGAKYLDRVNEDQRAVVRHATQLRDEVALQRLQIQQKKVEAEAAAAAGRSWGGAERGIGVAGVGEALRRRLLRLLAGRRLHQERRAARQPSVFAAEKNAPAGVRLLEARPRQNRRGENFLAQHHR